MKNLEQITDHLSLLGESPVWDEVEGRILWVDVLQGHIHQYYPHTKEHRIFETGQMTGSVAIRKAGGLIAALQNGFAHIYPDRGIVELLTDPEAHLPNNRFNDGKCDPAGRFWAGTMSTTNESLAGSLYVLEPDKTVSRKLTDVTCSNGMAWSPDECNFYYIDTPTREVYSFAYNKDKGRIGDRKTIIKIPENEGYPDGMTIDTEGMLWIAIWDGWQIQRWNPTSGELLRRIMLPVSRPTSCAFGGDGLKDLYITCASIGLEKNDLIKQPLAGSLLIMKNAGEGLPAFRYNG